MAVLLVPAAATASVGPDQMTEVSLDQESFSASGDGCALLPAALRRGTAGQLDQVTYLWNLTFPLGSTRGSATEKSQGQRAPRRPGPSQAQSGVEGHLRDDSA